MNSQPAQKGIQARERVRLRPSLSVIPPPQKLPTMAPTFTRDAESQYVSQVIMVIMTLCLTKPRIILTGEPDTVHVIAMFRVHHVIPDRRRVANGKAKTQRSNACDRTVYQYLPQAPFRVGCAYLCAEKRRRIILRIFEQGQERTK